MPSKSCVAKLLSIAAKLQLSARICAEALHLHRAHLEQGKRMFIPEYLVFSHLLISHSFLGVALIKVLLESRDHVSRRPILIVCTTNHALDSFLKAIQEAGVAKFVRLGGNSKKENWTKAFSLRAAARGLKKTTLERSREAQARRQVECQCSIPFRIF